MKIDELLFENERYAATALTSVICQLRFNPILAISSKPPVQFQEMVRRHFPRFEREDRVSVQFSPEAGAVEGRMSATAWKLSTNDKVWTANLTAEYLSLETTEYSEFPDFLSRLTILEEALVKSYDVPEFTRVGLRYINNFPATRFSGGWKDRFATALLGAAADPTIGGEVRAHQQAFALLSDNRKIIVRAGTSDEDDFVLDIDHFIEEIIPFSSAMSLLGEFHERIYRVFRWSITDKLRQELRPLPRASN